MDLRHVRTTLGIALSGLIAAGIALEWAQTPATPRPLDSRAVASGAAQAALPEVATPPAKGESPEQPVYVLVWIETVPPGATIRRVSDRAVLGRTPETIELPRSDRSETIRLELEEHLSAERDVPRSQDGRILVCLKPAPGKRALVPRAATP